MSKSYEMTRREFAKTSAIGLAGLAMARGSWAKPQIQTKKRYAIVGVGGRSRMYQNAIHKKYAEQAELVGICDTNEGRLRLSQEIAQKAGQPVPQKYPAADFDRMILETKADTVIVTTVDGFHHHYIIRALELGCDVITEKPMTIDAKKCQQIIDAQRKTGGRMRVAFNYRYSPPRTQIKDLLMAGTIGDILSVDFHWMLNTHHGADYFRRWHSQKKFSGGLMVHKATHHFDLVNWWLSAVPVSVMASGKRDFYTPAMAKRLGLQSHHERCHTCPEKERCGFELSLMKNPSLKELYLDNEQYDGYYRDRCVFRPDIDIEDTMNVLVTYDNQATMSYSVNAFNAWEGYYIVFNGTRGRLEHKSEEKVYLFGDGSTPGAVKPEGTWTRIFPLREPAYEVEVWTGSGGHGGGDNVMLDDIFLANTPADKYLRASDQRGGAYSILTGIAANICFKTGKQVEVQKLVKNIGYPLYPSMPTHADPLPMPQKQV